MRLSPGCAFLGHAVDHANVEPGGQIIQTTFLHYMKILLGVQI